MPSPSHAYDVASASTTPAYDVASPSATDTDPAYDVAASSDPTYDVRTDPRYNGATAESDDVETEEFEGFYAEPDGPHAPATSQAARAPGELVLNPVYLDPRVPEGAEGDREPSLVWAAGDDGDLKKRASSHRAASARLPVSATAAAVAVKRGGSGGPTRVWLGLFLLVALIGVAALALAASGAPGGSGDSASSGASPETEALRIDVDKLFDMISGSLLDSLRTQATNLEQRLDAAEARAGGLETRLEDAEATISAQAGRIDELSAALMRAESNTSAAVTAAQMAQQEAAAAMTQAEVATATLAALIAQTANQSMPQPTALAARVAALEVSIAAEDLSVGLKIPLRSSQLLQYCPLYGSGALETDTGDQAMNISSIGVMKVIAVPSGNKNTYGHSIAAGNGDGSVFVAGESSGDIYGGYLEGGRDAFVARLSSADGSVMWGRHIGSSSADEAHGVAVSEDEDVFVVGQTTGDVYSPNAGSYDVFVTRLSGVNGTEMWGRQFGNSSWDLALGVAVSEDGGVYVAGHTRSDMFGPNAGAYDVFVTRLSSAGGEEVWGRQFGSSADDQAFGVAVSGDGGVYVVGYTTGDMFGPSAGNRDVFVVRLSSVDGTEVWARQFGTVGSDQARGVAVSSDGSVNVVGSTSGVMYGEGFGLGDIFVTRLSGVDGSSVWGRQFGSSTSDAANSVAVDKDGGIVVTGATRGDLYQQNHNGADDFFVAYLGSGVDGLRAGVLGLGADGLGF